MHMCLGEEKERGSARVQECFCKTLWQQEKLEVFSSALLKHLENRGQGRRKKKRGKVTGIVRRK